MKEFDYIKDRLDDQIAWYSKKSQLNQKYYKRLQLLQIVLAVSIPILTLLLDHNDWIKFIIAVNGGLIAFIESANRVYNFKDLWTKYRLTTEALKREKIFYETQSVPYYKSANIDELIMRCERIMSEENTYWTDLQNKSANNA